MLTDVLITPIGLSKVASAAQEAAALVQSFNLIHFAVLVKDESISWTFPIATALGALGLFLASRTSASHHALSNQEFENHLLGWG